MNIKPKISITIPCRNEENYISDCLESIVNSNYPKDLFKVFVCDGCSDDSTLSIVNEFKARFPNNIEVLINERRTTPYALNLGLKQGGFDIKIILGAHSKIDSNYLLNCANDLIDKPDLGCVGGIINNKSENNIAEVISKAMSSSFGVGNAYFRTGEKSGYVDTVAFGAYRSEVFEKIGYFDEELVRNQDDEFNYRLIQSGYKIWLNPKIKADYFVRGDYKKLWKQYYQYGYWKVFVNQKHKAVTSIRQLIPFLLVLFSFSGPIAFIMPQEIIFLYGLGLCLYFIFAMLYAYKAAGSQKKIVFQIFYTFLILHYSYGLGYFNGVITFILLNRRPSVKNESLSR